MTQPTGLQLEEVKAAQTAPGFNLAQSAQAATTPGLQISTPFTGQSSMPLNTPESMPKPGQVTLNPSPVTTTAQLQQPPRTELDIMSLLNKNMERSNELFNNLSSFYSNPVSPEMQQANQGVTQARGEVDELATKADQFELDTANRMQGFEINPEATTGFVSRQQAETGRQAEYKRATMGVQQNAAQRKLQNALLTLQSAQATQGQKLEAAKFMYDANRQSLQDTLALYKETAPQNIGTEVNPTTGDVFVMTRNPVTGEVVTQKAGNVGAQKSYTSTEIKADDAGNLMFIGVKADGSLDVKPLGFKEEGDKQKFSVVTDAYGQQRVFNTNTGQFVDDGGPTVPVASDGTVIDPSLPYGGLTKMVYDRVSPLAAKFETLDNVKTFNKAAQGWDFMQSIDPNSTNPADNQGILYAFAKIMDPDSVVREGEYATVQKYSQSWLETFGFNAARVVNNQEFLTPEAIKNLQATATTKFDASKTAYQQTYNEYARKIDTVAGKQGIGRQFLTNYLGAYTEQKEFTPLDSTAGLAAKAIPLLKKYPYQEVQTMIQAAPGITEPELKIALEDLGYFLAPTGQPTKAAQVAPQVAPVVQKFPEGSKGGQCTTFLHSLVEFPPIGDGKNQKFSYVDRNGIPANQWRQQPQVGDIIVTGENESYGHTAMVNAILPDGRIQLTESNYKSKEKVSHDRVISINDKQIYGAIRGKLKATA